MAFIVVDRQGENSIAVAGGANTALTAEHVSESLARLAPRSGMWSWSVTRLQPGRRPPRCGSVATAARYASSNPAPTSGLDAATVALADFVSPNEGELAALRAVGIEPERALVSLGATGAELRTPERSVAIPAVRVEAVDTVGAGDTLNGALAAALASGRPLEEAARLAVRAATLAVTKPECPRRDADGSGSEAALGS